MTLAAHLFSGVCGSAGAWEGSDDKGRDCIRHHLGKNANSRQGCFAHKRDARVVACLPAFERESCLIILVIE